jgi:hypothetical protein
VRHDLAGFVCGSATLDRWHLGAALTAEATAAARNYVCTDEDLVVGYFSLCPHEVRRDELPSRLGHGAPQSIPAILLARLDASMNITASAPLQPSETVVPQGL